MTPTDKDRFFTYAEALPHQQEWTKGKARDLTSILRNKVVMEAVGRVLLQAKDYDKAIRRTNLGNAEEVHKAANLQGMAQGMERFVDALLELAEEAQSEYATAESRPSPGNAA